MIDPAAVNAANILGYKIPGINDSGESTNQIQDMFDKRKQALQSQRATHTNTAKYTALGNVLRSLVQPLGWAIGGAPAQVQPYDSRQYIDSFNRAVQYDNNVVNAGMQEVEYKIRSAQERAAIEQREKERQEQHKLRMAEIEARNKKGNASYDAAQGRAYFDYVRNYRIKELKGEKLPPLMSIDEFYGNPVENSPEVNGTALVAPANGSEQPKGVPPKPAKLELTPDEQAVISKWEKYDKNKDGILSSEEMKKSWYQFGKPKADSTTAETYREAIAKRNKIEGKKKLTARDIMK